MRQLHIKPLPTVIVSCCIIATLFIVYTYFDDYKTKNASQFERIQVDSRVIAFHHGGLPSNVRDRRVTFRDWHDGSMVRYEKMTKCQKELLPPVGLSQLIIPRSDREVWEWIRNRMAHLWDTWSGVRDDLDHRGLFAGFARKRILVLPGLLLGTNFARRSTIKNGGPLGELLQWADLIAGLYVLGHDVTLEHDIKLGIARLLDGLTSPGCEGHYDLVYVDVMALSALPHEITRAYRCRLRVLDVYGTQVMYNDPMYKELHRLKGFTGGVLLHLKQYNTFYPQTPDNSFLGFVVTSKPGTNSTKKEDLAVLYGKDTRYARAKENYIKQLTRYVEVHYTMSDTLRFKVPGPLINDGVLSGQDYAALLSKAKVVVGLGSPIEGTGAMDALAYGCVFINPRYTDNEQLTFKDGSKPTNRLVTSQIPYLEQYVGPPHVYTIDINNMTEVAATLLEVLSHTNYSPMIPEEFTTRGYLERLSSFVQHQDFCSHRTSSTWPPLALLRTVQSHTGECCTTTCLNNGMVCEPIYFTHINTEVYFASLNISCSVTSSDADIMHPSVSHADGDHICTLQEDSHLFSCEGQSEDANRICPCRHYRKHQIALPH